MLDYSIERLMFFFYEIIYILAFLCYLPILLIKGKYHPGFLMRLGVFAPSVRDKLKDKKVIWLHTVSVGEAQAAGFLINSLQQKYREFILVISTVTKTGNKIVQKLAAEQDVVIYFPFDISFVVKRVINFINPRLFIAAETEIWPNIINNLAKKNVPIVLVNGRLSINSFKGYKIIHPFLKTVLRKFTLFCMQTKEDAQRIVDLGAPEERVRVSGNMKFDLQAPSCKLQAASLGIKQNEQLLLAGSTHRGEERIILKVYQELLLTHQNLRLLIAPRHIERVSEIEGLIAKFGFTAQRVSHLNSSLQLAACSLQHAACSLQPILILDTIGQLKSLYALAELVFIGGSLMPHGGQNPIEAAVFSRPIIFGPYMDNFANVAEIFLKKDAAIMVKDAQQLKESCVRILNEPLWRKELGERARQLVEENRGATLRNLELIEEFNSHILMKRT